MRLFSRPLQSSLRAIARRSTPVLGAILLATACVGGETTSVANIPSNPAVETYASVTGVVIANMTRVNANLFIQDVTPGTGAEAVNGKALDMRYTGRLINGSTFDSNIGRAVFTFTLGAGQVIPGWDLGLVGMKVGGRRRLVIGSTLAYANQSPDPRTIPQNSTLVFDVELVAVR